MFKTKASVRLPSFFGPFALCAGLLTVICFSEPFWQNFYILSATSLNTTMKVGAWGVCTRLRNNTNVVGPSTWCTSKMSGFALKFVENATGINQFPTVSDDATLLGLNSEGAISILTAGATSALWLHVVAAIVSILTVASLMTPPTSLGSESSAIYRMRVASVSRSQKSGMMTIILGLFAFIITFITFCVDLSIIIPAKNKMNTIPGINAQWGNVQWFALPSFILMLPAFASVLMTANPPKSAEFSLVENQSH